MCVQVPQNRVRADIVGFVRFLHVQGVAVGIRVDGYRLDTEFGAGAYNTHSNFATVCNENFFDH